MRLSLAAALLVAVLALTVPLPSAALDALFAANLALALVLLLSVTTRPRRALRAAPTWLLTLAVLRVAATVAATRRILVHGDAGTLVRALGGALVGDSVLVGIVVFVVLALVMLLVIARGGERVAEVAARFALDALPGRQLSLDGDVRAGGSSAGAAGEQRTELGVESAFLGAMDGALKFVRGEVVASLAVVGVGLLGGLAVGVGQRGLTMDEALSRYATLTLGEALATQLPALASTVAAAVLVTRGDEEAEGPGRWFARLPSRVALAVSGCTLVLLSLVPGLPFLPLALSGGAALGVAAVLRPRVMGERVDVALVTSKDDVRAARRALDGAMAAFEARLGFSAGSFAVEAGGVEGRRLVLFGHDAGRVADGTLVERLVEAAPELLTRESLQAALRQLHRGRPDALPATLPSPERLLPVLRALLAEGLTLRELPTIVEAVGDASEPLPELVSRARVRLAREITALVAPDGELRAARIDPAILSVLQGSLRGGRLVLSQGASVDVSESLSRALVEGKTSVIILPRELRPYGRALVDVPARFVAAEELLPHIPVRITAVATMAQP